MWCNRIEASFEIGKSSIGESAELFPWGLLLLKITVSHEYLWCTTYM